MTELPNPWIDSTLAQATAVETAGAPCLDPMVAPAELLDNIATDYIPELFLTFAMRRSGPIVSPPIRKPERNVDELLDWDAMFDRILPPAPPKFLRDPSPEYLAAADMIPMLAVLAGH